MKQTEKTCNGTSFHGVTFDASVNELIQICGEPSYRSNDGMDKVNFEWQMETSEGEVFTIYDWKEYRSISKDETIEWHIGGNSLYVTLNARYEIEKEFNNIAQ